MENTVKFITGYPSRFQIDFKSYALENVHQCVICETCFNELNPKFQHSYWGTITYFMKEIIPPFRENSHINKSGNLNLSRYLMPSQLRATALWTEP